MDTSGITRKLSNKSVQWVWETMQRGIKQVSTYYDKIAEVSPLTEMTGDPHIMTSGVGPQYFEELEEKSPVTFVDGIEGYTVFAKRKDYALGAEQSMRLEDDMSIVGMENFFKKYVQEVVAKSAEPTIDNEFAKQFLYGGLTAGHKVFNNSPKALASGYGNLLYDSKPLYSLTATAHTAKGHATTYVNSLANVLTWDNAKAADVLLRSTNAYMENGRPMDMSQDLAVLVPPALGDTARVVFNTDRDPSTGNNGINPLKGRYEIIENPYLNALPTQWYLQRKKFGFKVFVNKVPKIRFWVEENTRIMRCLAVITIAMAVTNWRGSVGNNMKTS